VEAQNYEAAPSKTDERFDNGEVKAIVE